MYFPYHHNPICATGASALSSCVGVALGTLFGIKRNTGYHAKNKNAMSPDKSLDQSIKKFT